ncbi:uncharacterized protein C05D11.1-like [Pseudomyrmex gracilis]|uniref:uncharacterized protein C05D11.1-like n=1 Tax=Pseudomyrmex gracilis TaxID=219809 RepID=UPI0009958C6B|nr:uncharacterized protein C05D11.1-like [Pseudomyrmex gracilis]
MSCDKEHPLENTESFKQIYSGNVNDTMPLYIYRSVKTGITVCIAQSDGPFIDSDFNIVTETFDNDGLPYAVQHLIFTGSDDYNNNLKLWANRSLASNINASTSQNRTCFSMRAAGSETFLTLMPKYLNHILYPTLKDTAYLTEVHHVTGKANDGIVYRKIQIKERTSDYIIQKKMLRFLYPGKCGYNSLIYVCTKLIATYMLLGEDHQQLLKSTTITVV